MKRNPRTNLLASKALAEISGGREIDQFADDLQYKIVEHVAREAFIAGAQFGQNYVADFDRLRAEAAARYASPKRKFRTFMCSDKNRWQIRDGEVWVSEYTSGAKYGPFEQHVLSLAETCQDWIVANLWDDLRGLVDLIQNPEE